MITFATGMFDNIGSRVVNFTGAFDKCGGHPGWITPALESLARSQLINSTITIGTVAHFTSDPAADPANAAAIATLTGRGNTVTFT